ncbi:MAG: chemotaxis protein CheX [Eubacterium sp.]|nr:chemotaxis protein CheX [Eubacterium sp.]
MYTQFFGNFLLGRNIVTPEQLVEAIGKESTSHIKLGTLAMYHNLMTANEIDDIVVAQTHEDKQFGELAIERHYLTEEQVNRLLSEQSPEYLLLGQILIESGIITNSELEDLIIDYESEHEIFDLDLQIEQKEQVIRLIRHYFNLTDVKNNELFESYLMLLFNNLIRFIGSDFTPLAPIRCDEFPTHFGIVQHITGKYNITTAVDMSCAMAIEFASRYAMDTFDAFDEYVQASLEDFLNLHNGLFTVNASNNYAIELQLSPPEQQEDTLVQCTPDAVSYLFPVLYPFGTINFLLSF